jgi:hypothetical protein
MLPGHWICGGCVSRMTVTVNWHCPMTVPPELAMQVTGCTPSPSGVPMAGLQVMAIGGKGGRQVALVTMMRGLSGSGATVPQVKTFKFVGQMTV